MAISLTAADLERFMTAGARVESEMQTMEATMLACKADAERYRKIRQSVEGNDARQLRFIQRFIQADTGASLDNFVDNLGA